MRIMEYINIKNGKTYVVLNEAIDYTNSRDGTMVFIYCQLETPDKVFVRDKDEFLSKFKLKTT